MSFSRDHLWSSPEKKRKLKMGWRDATQYILNTVSRKIFATFRIEMHGLRRKTALSSRGGRDQICSREP